MFKLFFKKNEKTPEYFIALLINSETIGAAVFTPTEGQAKILGLAFEKTGESWEEIIEVIDLAISKAGGNLDLTKIKKVVFGFSPDFIEQDKISKARLPYLKKLTQELELIPSGFVVIPEAVNFYLENTEDGPQTNILIGILKTEIIISLFRGGKLFQQVLVPRDANVCQDIEKALLKFENVDIFPSKILLYAGEDLESVKNELLKYPWQNNNKFLHYPKIEIFPQKNCLMAVVEAAVSELNKKIPLTEVEIQKPSPILPIHHSSAHSVKKVAPEDLGFIKESNQILVDEEAKEDLNKTDGRKNKIKQLITQFNPFSNRKHKESDQIVEKHPQQISSPANIFKKITGNVKLVLGIVIVLLISILSIVYFFYYYPKATLSIIVDPKVFEQEKEVSLNLDITSPSESTDEIPGKTLTSQASGTKTIPATGKKIIGDPAKGTVVIYNKTASARTFDKGTKLSTKNLVFTLNDKIDIPGATETAEGLAYGKSNAAITAAKIGPEGNLTSKNEFTVADFSSSSYSARNDQALSGGTSREVSAVASIDRDNLFSQLSQELQDQSLNDLKIKLISGEKLLEESLAKEIVSRKYSSEVDQEAKELTLNLDLEFRGVVYKEEDFTLLMEKAIKSNIPEGYEFKPEQASLKVSKADTQEGEKVIKFKADYIAKLFPNMDTEKIKSDIVGMSVISLEKYIKSLSNIVGYEIKFNTKSALVVNSLPRNIKNIKIEIKAR